MEFTYIADGIDAVVIDNFYTEDQLKLINIELKWLCKKSIMSSDKESLVPAVHPDSGEIMTKKSGVFLEAVFKNWNHSALISFGFEQTNTEEFRTNLLKYNGLFKLFFHCNIRNHLLSYYENSDYYKPHIDSSIFTILNYFNIEPKQFSGGELVLHNATNSKQATIEYRNNRTVIIASCTMHEVKPIVSNMSNSLSGYGRFCNSVFIGYEDSRETNTRKLTQMEINLLKAREMKLT